MPEVSFARHGGGYLDAISESAASTPAPALPALPARAEVVGMPLAIGDYGAIVDWAEQLIAAGGRATLTAAAVNLVMSAREDPRVRAAVHETTLAVPDGQPLVWALHALGHGGATRIYGPDLMLAICARAAARSIPMFLYGGRTPEALELLATRLRERFPGLVIAGSYWPPFRPLDESEQADLIRAIEQSGAAIVWVGTGQPKQELWMAEMRPRLSAPLLAAVGAAFDFHAGLVVQAPAWMQRAGLEWCYRLAREPRRLWRRYARYNPRFVACFARQYAAQRRGSREPPAANL